MRELPEKKDQAFKLNTPSITKKTFRFACDNNPISYRFGSSVETFKKWNTCKPTVGFWLQQLEWVVQGRFGKYGMAAKPLKKVKWVSSVVKGL